MPTARSPAYASEFHCIGPACEDSCCIGWSVYLDEATWNKYQLIPADALRSGSLQGKIAEQIVRVPPNPETPQWFARIQMNADRACPFLNEQKLCQIQSEYGESYLSTTCATYPRIRHRIDGAVETSLSLSCPEAARLILLNPSLLTGRPELSENRASPEPSPVPSPELSLQPSPVPSHPEGFDAPSGARSLLPHFWAIRAFTVELITNRDYALWQRLFLLGLFTRRMDALSSGELSRSFSVVLREFHDAVASGTLRATMETIPADLRLQLEMVLRLASLPLPRSHVSPRFLETAKAFANGLGNGPHATMDTLLAAYSEAYTRFYAPWFDRHPHVMENLLVNHIFRSLFPFGQTAGAINTGARMAQEFSRLVTQFTLFKGLLIGVAGYYREAFAAEDVVPTIQSASKHFEHHPRFLDDAHALLVSAGLDNVRGLTMLLRN